MEPDLEKTMRSLICVVVWFAFAFPFNHSVDVSLVREQTKAKPLRAPVPSRSASCSVYTFGTEHTAVYVSVIQVDL